VKLKLDSDCPPPGDGVNVNIEMLPEVEISPDWMVKVAELELQGGFALKSWSIPLKRSFVPAVRPWAWGYAAIEICASHHYIERISGIAGAHTSGRYRCDGRLRPRIVNAKRRNAG